MRTSGRNTTRRRTADCTREMCGQDEMQSLIVMYVSREARPFDMHKTDVKRSKMSPRAPSGGGPNVISVSRLVYFGKQRG